MKKVCHMTTVHQRYDVRILRKECVSLARHGYDVTLLVDDNLKDECIDGVKIVSISSNARNRIERIFYSSKIMLQKAYEINADIYHFHDPELIPTGVALTKKGKKVIYDSHEDTPGDIKERYWIPKYLRGIISFLFARYENCAAQKFNAIITVTPFIVERFKIYNRNTFMITNYPLLTAFNGVTNSVKHNQVCFTGMVDPIWSHQIVLQALEGTNVKYVVAGKVVNNYLEYLQQCVGKENLEYVGLLPFNEVSNIHRSSIAGLAILKPAPNDKNNEGTLGNQKIFEYMNSGIPVICSNLKLWKEIVTKYNCGVCVDFDSPQQIHDTILDLVNNPQKAHLMGLNGRKAVEQEFNWQTQEKILLNLYESVINNFEHNKKERDVHD